MSFLSAADAADRFTVGSCNCPAGRTARPDPELEADIRRLGDLKLEPLLLDYAFDTLWKKLRDANKILPEQAPMRMPPLCLRVPDVQIACDHGRELCIHGLKSNDALHDSPILLVGGLSLPKAQAGAVSAVLLHQPGASSHYVVYSRRNSSAEWEPQLTSQHTASGTASGSTSKQKRSSSSASAHSASSTTTPAVVGQR